MIKFVLNSKDTSGGDGPEFYEPVIKKILEETQWREGSTRTILLIADAVPYNTLYDECEDSELEEVYSSYKNVRNRMDP